MSVISKNAIAGAALLVGLALSGGSAQASLTLIADSSAPIVAADEPVVASTTTRTPDAGSDAMAAKVAPSHRSAKRTTPRYRVASESQPQYAPSRWRPATVHGVTY